MKLLVFALSIVLQPCGTHAGPTPNIADKIVLCASCHGNEGQASNPEWPHIAGQHPGYFSKQLQDFQNPKKRSSPLMSAISSTLTDDEIVELAKHYAQLTPALGVTPKKFVARGQQLYRMGDSLKKIPACIACHGPQGQGNDWAGFPVLSGQHPTYTITQLRAFKDKTRTNDMRQIMQDICSRLDEADIVALAHYLSGLH